MLNWKIRSRPAAALGLNLDCMLLMMSATVLMSCFLVFGFSGGLRRDMPDSSVGDEFRGLQQLEVSVVVEGSQGHLGATEFQVGQRGVDDLPVQLEGLRWRNADESVQQGGDGAARGENGNARLRVAGLFDDPAQPPLDPGGEALPAFQARLVQPATQPAIDDELEQALELAAVTGGVAQDIQGAGLVLEQFGQVGADQFVGLEFVEGRLDAQRRRWLAMGAQALQGMLGGVALALQFAAVAVIQAGIEAGKVFAEDLRLANAIGAEDVVVVRTE